MKNYTASNIRNVAIVGQGGSGKTTLCEAIICRTGLTSRMGTIMDGTTVSDNEPEEIRRRSSLSTSLLPVEYDGCKINLLDAPGLFDFAAGMYEAVQAVDSVLIVVSGKSGVCVGTKKAYNLAKKLGKSISFFVTKLDNERADYYKVLEQLKSEFGPAVCPLVAPVVKPNEPICYVDLLSKKAYTFKDSIQEEVELPEFDHSLDGLDVAICEAVAETDEELFEKYFSGETFTKEELICGLHTASMQGNIQPVFCGSSEQIAGIDMLLLGITKLMPSADYACEQSEELCAQVFKTIVDPYYGKLSFIRVYSGKLSSGDLPINSSTGQAEKIGKLMSIFGKDQEEIEFISSGDIAAATKLDLKTGDELYTGKSKDLKVIEYPTPCYSKAIVTNSDESKVSSAINKLLQEDLTLGFNINTETSQQILSGLGSLHLDVSLNKLKTKFGVKLELDELKIPYRETIRKKTKVQGKYKKQTGGHGQFGDVWVEFEPSETEEIVFEQKVFGGAVPKGYFPAVEKGIKESAKQGLIAGYPMVGLKATLVDGSYHPVDSSEMAFKTAASLAYKAGILECSPTLLEPIDVLKVSVPDENTGDMMGELNKRRGRVIGMNPNEEQQGETVIEASVPEAEFLDFAETVRQMTQGAGSFTLEFEGYEQLPEMLKENVINQTK